MKFIYKKVLKPVLFLFDPELIHTVFVFFGEILGSNPITRFLISLPYKFRGKDISKVVDGITYKTPVLLSAGFDYNGRLAKVLSALSFGGEEVGSVTYRPCVGNPKPRLRRLLNTQSILVNKGLRNDGIDKIIKRIKRKGKSKDFVLGVSIARTNDQKTSSIEESINDFAQTFRKFNEEDIGDFYTINISCPNAFGGEDFGSVDLLPKLLQKIKNIECKRPIYIKMPINRTWDEFKSLLDICDRFSINGVVIGNLNKDYSFINGGDIKPDIYSGGLSGRPCFDMSNDLIRKTREQFGDRFTIIGVGGIFSYEDAREKFNAGADLVELITGMIFEGPQIVREICSGIAKSKS